LTDKTTGPWVDEDGKVVAESMPTFFCTVDEPWTPEVKAQMVMHPSAYRTVKREVFCPHCEQVLATPE
jgi:hypothetical protein